MREITINQFRTYLNRGISKPTLKKALNRGCIVVENEAKKNCPVGRTGLLRNSIKHRVEDNEGIVGTVVDYGPYV